MATSKTNLPGRRLPLERMGILQERYPRMRNFLMEVLKAWITIVKQTIWSTW